MKTKVIVLIFFGCIFLWTNSAIAQTDAGCSANCLYGNCSCPGAGACGCSLGFPNCSCQKHDRPRNLAEYPIDLFGNLSLLMNSLNTPAANMVALDIYDLIGLANTKQLSDFQYQIWSNRIEEHFSNLDSKEKEIFHLFVVENDLSQLL